MKEQKKGKTTRAERIVDRTTSAQKFPQFSEKKTSGGRPVFAKGEKNGQCFTKAEKE